MSKGESKSSQQMNLPAGWWVGGAAAAVGVVSVQPAL